MMYTINACAFEKVQKIFNRYAKKANAVGLKPTLEVVREYEKKVPHYAVDDVRHELVRKPHDIIIEVMDIELNYPEYKLGDYTVAAVVEHGENDNNMVYPCGNYDGLMKYAHGKGVCEHCGTNHYRVKTVVLINADGEYKQVGTNCLKEYTGVDEFGLIHAYRALEAIIDENLTERGFVGEPNRYYIETRYFLEQCIHLYNVRGYNKENKYDADNVKEKDITEAEIETANNVIEFFNNLETEDIFLNDVKVAVTREFAKPNNGFIAYAVVAYEKELERIKREAERNANNANAEYFGNVGERIEIEVTGRAIAGYNTQFGYTYIYKFTDNNNHTFIWKTTNTIDTDDKGVFNGAIKGTIKEHNEYNGEKQTVLTRCKAREIVNA